MQSLEREVKPLMPDQEHDKFLVPSGHLDTLGQKVAKDFECVPTLDRQQHVVRELAAGLDQLFHETTTEARHRLFKELHRLCLHQREPNSRLIFDVLCEEPLARVSDQSCRQRSLWRRTCAAAWRSGETNT